jgi:hypothetical protein
MESSRIESFFYQKRKDYNYYVKENKENIKLIRDNRTIFFKVRKIINLGNIL